MNKSFKFKIFYYADSLEAEVFQFLKSVNAIKDIPHAITNFYLPRATLNKSSFENTFRSFEELTSSHLEAQKDILFSLKETENRLDIYRSERKKVKHSRTSAVLDFDFHNSLDINEVFQYLSSFSTEERVKIIKTFITSWYLFTAKYQTKNYSCYAELLFVYERGKNLIFNEINYLNNFINSNSLFNKNKNINHQESNENSQKSNFEDDEMKKFIF